MSHSPQVKFIQEWHQAFQTKDLDLLENSIHDDFRHYAHPSTIGHHPLTKASYVGELRKIIPTWTDSKLTTHFMFEAPGKVITHLTNETKSDAGNRAPFETLIIATIVTDHHGGLKIKQIDEWLDSKVYAETQGFTK